MPIDGGRKFGEKRSGRRLAGSDRIECAIKGIQRCQAVNRRRVALIREIVGGARETVYRQHGRPQAPWQQERRNRKIFVMGNRHVQQRTTR